MSRPVFLGAVSYRHGQWNELETLVERAVASADEVQFLKRCGLSRYSVMEKPLRKNYASCVTHTLEQAGMAASEVDAVIFFTSTFESYEDYDDLAILCDSLGLINALPMGSFLGQCSNYSTALASAASAIRAGDLDNVLLLGADLLDEERGKRVLGGRLSVFSDGVVSCLVSAHRGAYELGPIRHHYLPHMYKIDPNLQIADFIKGFSDGYRTACHKLYAATGLSAGDFALLVPANLNLSVLKNFAALAGIPQSRMFTENVARYGHTFACDQLISLSTLCAPETGLKSGERALVVGVGGSYLFSALSVVRVDAEERR